MNTTRNARRMPARLALIAAAAALALGASPAGAQGRGTVEILPLLTSGGTEASWAIAFGLNDRGQVVGTFFTESQHGFIWNPGDFALSRLAPAAAGSQAYAISNSGRVVGDFLVSSSGTLTTPMTWTAATGARQLPSSASEPYGRVWAVSSTGRMVGYAFGSTLYAAQWNDAGTLPQLSQPDAYFLGINDQGEAVGRSGVNPWISDAQGGTALPFTGTAHDINNRSVVVGERQGTGAFAWTRSNGSVDLGTLGGSSRALAINDAGQVVGESVNTTTNAVHAFIWTPGAGMTDIGRRYDPASPVRLQTARSINALAQIAGEAVDESDAAQPRTVAYRLTLHPDWQGGSGHWNSATNWNWGGTGVADVRVGTVHQVVIDPQRSITVWGGSDAQALSLQLGGTGGHAVSLDLNGGTTAVAASTTIGAGGVLRGSGTLESGVGMEVYGRVQVDAGQRMLLAGPNLANHGAIRVVGTAFQPAQLEVSGWLLHSAGAQMQLQQGQLSVAGGASLDGQVSLESARFDSGSTWVGGQLLVSFGRSSLSGPMVNNGQIIVANGAEASFYGPLHNEGELRVSSGGAANFFGPVSGAGSFTGNGEARFEGGLSIGNSPGVATLEFDVVLNSALLAEIGGTQPGNGDSFHDKVIFNGDVTLLQAPLDVVWWSGFSGQAGDRFDLFDWNGTLTGSFSVLNLPSLADGLVWDTSDLYLGGSLAVTAVPEPAGWALMFGGVAWLLARRRALTPAVGAAIG